MKLPSAPAKGRSALEPHGVSERDRDYLASAPMFMVECFLRTEARTACRRAHWPLPRRLNRIPCR